MGCWLGLTAFVLFFISDYNDWRLSRRELKLCFPAGAVLLAAGTVLEARRGSAPASGWLRGLFFMLGALFLALLQHLTFFVRLRQVTFSARLQLYQRQKHGHCLRNLAARPRLRRHQHLANR